MSHYVVSFGYARTIRLSSRAIGALQNLDRDEGPIFRVSANALRLAWERLKRRAEIMDLRFHDLLYEAVSRIFEHGLSLAEVTLFSKLPKV